ncbi:XdhC family protein [Aquiflexum sp. LQ15W]|uniref:XdhC family protein n=1 Tax=Cognataquiflexum nitidum TaxID=2922272 RepID=UPI001F13309A|nr:XdhC/CoxI family protein [Cognataquiflexum nitidum]MCH6200762.1 XdhC family protein [Cognataquiflexum nitidum]
MKDLQQIIQAYQNCKIRKQKAALATVVKVDGSAYRRPGARMLVTEDGELTGAISGGCLEGDALRKAQTVIFQQRSMLVTYDTTDEDDQKFGVGLGCNGIIQVLIEPLDFEDESNPAELLKVALSDRLPNVLVTAFSLKNTRGEQIGTRVLSKGGNTFGKIETLDPGLSEKIHLEINTNAENQVSSIKQYSDPEEIWVFYEAIIPPIHILLFGAGNDTIPVAQLASLMGWELTLIDGRKNHATTERFPTAAKIIIEPADRAVSGLNPDKNTVALLMTHNFDYEAVVLKDLMLHELPYIGILGPKKKTDKLIARLESEGIKVPTENIYAPIGLDIGAEGSEEIALSALAEIKAVLAKKNPDFLKNKLGPIHEER